MTKKKERWVIKVGSSLISHREIGIDEDFIKNLASQIIKLLKENIEVIIVSSGAIAKGIQELNLELRPKSLNLLQATAAVGQLGLINSYREAFKKYNLITGQVLVSHSDIVSRQRYLNARHSLTALLNLKVIPVVNENDSVSTEEITFGDNDTLAGAVVGLVEADKFIMLTDQEGVFTEDPKNNNSAQLLSKIDLNDKTLDLEKITQGTAGLMGRGGMRTKIKAARLSIDSGSKTWVCDGRVRDILIKIKDNKEVGTFFEGQKDRLQSRKKWIASMGTPKGKVFIDDGAAKALITRGSSLLPVGVEKIEGDFDRGDLLVCLNKEKEIARGLSNFKSSEIRLVLGQNSQDISSTLDYITESELIHRDNLVLT
ncbi:MAG: glutamate 5-kinase [Gammaproteobacteria bacterium]|nr:glutamate 5-kinase [Gammaproteobacteria bacterium]|tara:strand:- start:6836 stop:7948 length:1113 start_codon:yes stop_codon:yes gene_type:complete